jgi:threonine aldolase
MATHLEQRLRDLPGLRILFPRQANSVFLELPPPVIQTLQAKGWQFYTFIGVGGARLMCSWNTSRETVDQFADDLQKTLSQAAGWR